MTDVKRKVCLVGDFAVGKTSLAQRYVNEVFSDQYLTTIGVKIDTKEIAIGDQHLKLVIWDVAGRDSLSPLNAAYLVGAAGYIMVVDGTRRETIDYASALMAIVQQKLPEQPFVVLVNKVDLQDKWLFTDNDLKKFESFGWQVRFTSAKSGDQVEDSFRYLAEQLLG